MTREEFLEFITTSLTRVYVPRPWLLVECRCGDVNCHGWRIRTAPADTVRSFDQTAPAPAIAAIG